jgi:hypothetical protein
MSKKPSVPEDTIAYTLFLTKEVKKENDFTPPRTIYTGLLGRDGELLNVASASPSPMITKTLGKDGRKRAHMVALGQLAAEIAKLIVADAADKIVGEV